LEASFAIETDLAGIRMLEAGDDAQQCGLAATGRSQQRESARHQEIPATTLSSATKSPNCLLIFRTSIVMGLLSFVGWPFAPGWDLRQRHQRQQSQQRRDGEGAAKLYSL
jgi:hypothetical protein